MRSTTAILLLALGATSSIPLKLTGRARPAGTIDALGPIRLGAPSPDGELVSLAGETVSLSALRGKTVLLQFGTTWCGPCRAMAPALRRLARDTALEIVSVEVGEDLDDVKAFHSGSPPGLRILVDATGEVARRFGVRAYPTLVLVDEQGIVRMISVGMLHDMASLQRSIEKALSS